MNKKLFITVGATVSALITVFFWPGEGVLILNFYTFLIPGYIGQEILKMNDPAILIKIWALIQFGIVGGMFGFVAHKFFAKK